MRPSFGEVGAARNLIEGAIHAPPEVKTAKAARRRPSTDEIFLTLRHSTKRKPKP
jgi:hypothetical protein